VLTQTVNQAAAGTMTLAASNLAPQYSDLDTFTATYSPAAGAPVPRTVTFKVGTQVLGDAPLNLVGTSYQATWTGQMVEPSPFGTAPTGQMKPGAHTVTATTSDANFVATTGSRSISIAKEDARVTNTTPTTVKLSPTGTMVLTASVKDISAVVGDPATDPYPGDIRNATVTFVDRGGVVNIATVNVAADGSASFTWTPTLGTAVSKTYTIGFIVSNYYNRNSTLDNVTITVTK